MGMRVVEQHTEKVRDDNYNLYLQRAERCLRNKDLDGAKKELEFARKYSDNNIEVKSQCDLIEEKISNVSKQCYEHLFKSYEDKIENHEYIEGIEYLKLAIDIVDNDQKKKELIEELENQEINMEALEKECQDYFSQAYKMIKKGNLDEAILTADKALEKYKSVENKNERKRIIEKVDDIKNKNHIDELFEEVYECLDEKKYFDILILLEQIQAASKGKTYANEIYDKVINIKHKIKLLNSEELYIIAQNYEKINKYNKAIEWYKVINNDEARFNIAMININKLSKVSKGIEQLEKLCQHGYCEAVIAMLIISVANGVKNRKYLNANRYYKQLRGIDKQKSKDELKILKRNYNLKNSDMLKIKGLYKIINSSVAALIIIILFSIFMAFYTGKIHGKINNVKLLVNNKSVSEIYINSENQYDIDFDIFPFFALKPKGEIQSLDTSIVKVSNGELIGVSEGATSVVLLFNGKEYQRYDISVIKKITNDSGNLDKSPTDSNFPNNKTNKSNNLSNKDNSYILSYSNSKYLTYDDIKNLSKDDLAYARNEIYARHGYIFNDEKYKKYFENKAWYKPDSSFKGQDNELNDYERKNAYFILEYENSQGNGENVTYINYVNDRFGYSIDYPSYLTNKKEWLNYAGMLAKDYEGKVQFSVGAYNNVMNQDVKTMYNNVLNSINGFNVTYKQLFEHAYVVAYEDSNTAYYQFCRVGKEAYVRFGVTYPTSQQDKYDKVIQHMYDSFKVGDLEKGY